MAARVFLIVLAAATLAGCGGGSDEPPEASLTPGITATQGPGATSTPAPTQAAPAAPLVEWLTLNHAGAGAVTLVFRTNVPTTASARGLPGGSPENANPMPPERDEKLSTDHTISLGTGGVDLVWEVTVTDEKGRAATASIESGEIVQRQYWARAGDGMPKVTMEGNRKASATWWNLYGQGDTRPGHVILMAKRAGCTTADGCLGTPAGTFDGDSPTVSADRLAEQHAIRFEFPDTTRDYQVLLVGVPAEGVRAFYQVDVLATAIR